MNVLELSADLQCELIRTLDPKSDTSAMLTRIAERVASELDASACSVYTIDPGAQSATQQAGTGYQAQFVNRAHCRVVPASEVPKDPTEDQKLGLTGWILSTGKPFLAKTPDELVSHPHRLGIHDVKQLPGSTLRLDTFLGVPLRGLRGEVIGVIKAERLEFLDPDALARPFSVHDQIVLETAARMASKCLTYLDVARENDLDGAISAWARDVIGDAAASEGELDTFLSSVVNVIAAAMHSDSCGIFLIDRSLKTLTQRAGCGSQDPRRVIRSYLLPSEEQIESGQRVGLTAWIAATGKPFYARNFEELRSHPHHRGEFDTWNFPDKSRTVCGAFLGMPLQLGGTTIGVVKVENISSQDQPDSREFSEDARRRFDLLSQDVALAIVRLQEERLPARYEVITRAEPTIFGILRGGLNVRPLVEKVVSDTGELFDARACALFLKEGNRLVQPLWAGVGYAQVGGPREYELVEPGDIKDNPGPEEKVGLTAWIAVKQKKYIARSNLELKMHPHHKGVYDSINFVGGERCESFMGEPLIVGGKLVGVLKVETKQKVEKTQMPDGQVKNEKAVTYFSEQDELVFDLIANSAAIAIENARLSEAAKLAEQIRNQPQRLLLDLHDFVKDHLWAVETLNQAAISLRRDKRNIAQIVEEYGKLLERLPNPDNLDGFARQLTQFGDFLQASHEVGLLYTAYAEALSVSSVADISRLCVSKGAAVQLEPADRLFLSESVRLLRDMYDKVRACGHGRAGLEGRAPLDQARQELKKTAEDSAVLDQPERGIMIQIIEHWLKVIDHEVPPFREVHPNPYVAGPPIIPREGNPFFGRYDIFDWVAKNIRGENQPNTLVLYGERRMGKTSILLQLHRGELGRNLREHGDPPVCPVLCPVMVDLLGFPEVRVPEFLHNLARLIHNSMDNHPGIGRSASVPPLSDFERTSDCFNGYMERVSSLVGSKLLVVMLDEFERLEEWVGKGTMSSGIYAQLRHQMQFLPNVAFILAGTHQLRELSPDGLGLVFAIARHQEVGFMRDEEASALVREPVAGRVVYEPAAVTELLRITHGHPYLLQVLCTELITAMNEKRTRNFIELADLQPTIENLGRDRGEILVQMAFPGLSDNEKAVLRVATRLVEVDQKDCTAAALASLMSRTSEEVGHLLPRLVRRRLIEEVSSKHSLASEKLYRPVIPLVSQWLLLMA